MRGNLKMIYMREKVYINGHLNQENTKAILKKVILMAKELINIKMVVYLKDIIKMD